jgi:hypothetical protein
VSFDSSTPVNNLEFEVHCLYTAAWLTMGVDDSAHPDVLSLAAAPARSLKLDARTKHASEQPSRCQQNSITWICASEPGDLRLTVKLRSCTKYAIRVQYASNLILKGNRATSNFTEERNPD